MIYKIELPAFWKGYKWKLILKYKNTQWCEGRPETMRGFQSLGMDGTCHHQSVLNGHQNNVIVNLSSITK